MAQSKYEAGTIISTSKGDVRVLSRRPGRNTKGLPHRHPRLVIEILKTGTVLDVQQGNVLNGKFNDYRERTVYGVGYLGSNITVPNRGVPHIVRRIYDLWANMLKRAYGGYDSCYSYADVEVDSRWHNFTTFLSTVHKIPGYSEWEKGDKRMNLDKDIRGRGKRMYALDTCMFVTPAENTRECAIRRWHGCSASM